MKRIIAPAAVFIILLSVYIWTLGPGTFWADSAAFAACNEILGLPHSPSFPAYTVLGRVFHLFFLGHPALASNLYSATTSAVGGVVLYLIVNFLLTRFIPTRQYRQLVSASCAIFAFVSLPAWQSSVRAEVYSLQILLSLLVIFAFLKGMASSHRRIQFILLAVFLQGISFANHSLLALITIPLFPVLAIELLKRYDWATIAKTVFVASALFVVALSLYFYLPIRANQNPQINSGQPKTLTATFHAITRTGEDYLPDSRIASPDYFHRAKKLLFFIFDQTGGFIVIGFISALFFAIKNRSRELLVFFIMALIGFAVTVWAADFRLVNFDIVAYSGLPLICCIVLAFYGLYSLAAQMKTKMSVMRFVPLIVILMAFFEFYGNLYASDLAMTCGPDRLAVKILQTAPPNAILLVNEDDIALPLWFFQYALNERPDVAVLSAGALYRPDYRGQLKVNYPTLNYPASFEAHKITDLGSVVGDFCRANDSLHPILVQYGVPGIKTESLLPSGFLFRYESTIPDSIYLSEDDIMKTLQAVAGDATDLLTTEFVARNAFNFGAYFDKIGRPDKALQFFQYAIETDADNPDYLLRLGIAFLNAGRSRDAILLLQQATETGDGCPEAERILNKIKEKKLG